MQTKVNEAAQKKRAVITVHRRWPAHIATWLGLMKKQQRILRRVLQ